jgi:predicted metal-dependent hydrolase
VPHGELLAELESLALAHTRRSEEYGEAGRAQEAREYAEAALRAVQAVATIEKNGSPR